MDQRSDQPGRGVDARDVAQRGHPVGDQVVEGCVPALDVAVGGQGGIVGVVGAQVARCVGAHHLVVGHRVGQHRQVEAPADDAAPDRVPLRVEQGGVEGVVGVVEQPKQGRTGEAEDGFEVTADAELTHGGHPVAELGAEDVGPQQPFHRMVGGQGVAGRDREG